MSTPTAPVVSDPASLFAEIPGMLGFYPESSIILLCLDKNDSSRFSLGPVIRADLTDAETLCEAPIVADIILTLVVSDEEEDDFLVDEAVMVLLEAEALPIEGIWHVPAIAQEERVTLLWGADTVPDEWAEGGTIPAIFATNTMRDSLNKGTLLSENREDLAPRWWTP